MPVKKTPEKKKEFDLEETIQSRMAQKRALMDMRKATHPEESGVDRAHEVNRFVSLGKQDREKQASMRVNWEREFMVETGRCSTGGNPEYGRRAGPRPVIHEVKRPVLVPLQPGMVAPAETELERLRRENAELRAQIEAMRKELTQMRVDMGKLVDYIDKMQKKS